MTLIATGLDHNSLKPSQDPATNEKMPTGNPGFGASLRNLEASPDFGKALID